MEAVDERGREAVAATAPARSLGLHRFPAVSIEDGGASSVRWRTGSLRSALRRGLHAHALFLVVAGVYLAAAVTLIFALTGQGPVGYGRVLVQLLATAVGVSGFMTGAAVVRTRMALDRASGGTLTALEAYRRAWRIEARRDPTTDRAAGILLVIPVLALVLTSFSTIKQLRPAFAPLVWDIDLMQLDRALHFGRHPWEWLHPVLGHPWITVAIDQLYLAPWLALTVLTLGWQASARPSKLRTQYLISFVFVWAVVGNVLATVFSSGGPCYFALVGGDPETYRGLLEYLRRAGGDQELRAVWLQRELWRAHTDQIPSFGNGVSAMPSAHVAKAVLCALVITGHSRRAGAVVWAFAAVILIGSVHLGWHYAIDGYVAIAVAVATWVGVGRMIDWWDRTAEEKRAEDLRGNGRVAPDRPAGVNP